MTAMTKLLMIAIPIIITLLALILSTEAPVHISDQDLINQELRQQITDLQNRVYELENK